MDGSGACSSCLLYAANDDARRAVESYCVPYFDSPSIFARILDKDKVCQRCSWTRTCLRCPQGGHFSINPHPDVKHTVKQAYLPSSNVRGLLLMPQCSLNVRNRSSLPSMRRIGHAGACC